MNQDGGLGELPSHWTVTRLGALGTLSKGVGGSKEDNQEAGLPVVRYGELYTRFDRLITQAFSFIREDDAPKYTPLKTGSIVFAGSGEDAEVIGKSALSLIEGPAFVGGDTVVFTPDVEGVYPMYLTYVLESQPLKAAKAVRSTGFTVVHISAGKLKTLLIPLPPAREQRSIADFLDRETAHIDATIEAQRELVERLEERRQAMLTRVVFAGLGERGTGTATRGVHYKLIGFSPLALDLGLSRVPDAWDIVRFKPAMQRLEVRNADGEATLMSLTSRGLVVPRTETGDRQQPAEDSIPRYLMVHPGDLIINPMWLTGGAIGVSQTTGAVSPDYRVFRSRGAHHPRYLHHLLRAPAFLEQYRLYTRAQTTFDRRVQQDDIDNLPLPTPPIDEQVSIARNLDEATAHLDATVAAANDSIALMQERRSALITAAVTGRIDPSTGRETTPTQQEQ